MDKIGRGNESSIQNKIKLWESAEWEAIIEWLTETHLSRACRKEHAFDGYNTLHVLLKKQISPETAWILQAFIAEIRHLAPDEQGQGKRYCLMSQRGIFLFLMRYFWGNPALFQKKCVLLFELYCYHVDTFFHSVRVAVLTVWLGMECGYSNVQVEDLLDAALFHDIGKLGIGEALLSKPGRLTNQEQTAMQNHPQAGLLRLQKEDLGNICVLQSVYQHHERYDGQGYPNGLQSEQIHKNARMLAVTDVYDALVSGRTFKAACLPLEAMQMMQREMEGFFDKALLRIFFRRVLLLSYNE